MPTGSGYVKFPTNVPVEVELKFDHGLEVQSQFGGDQAVSRWPTTARCMSRRRWPGRLKNWGSGGICRS